MFIQTEATPNPATLKFLPGLEIMGTASARDFPDEASARRSPLATQLFAIDAVSGVFFGADFIAVTKSSGEWQHLKPAVLGAVMDHFTRGDDLLDPDMASDDEAGAGDEDEVVAQIIELLDTRVRPAVAQDGGDIIFNRFDAETGTVYLQMRGACAGCPSSEMTLKSGIENLLKHYVPEVNQVEPA
jgi:Fe-S cluster biogenesis protein NfuA